MANRDDAETVIVNYFTGRGAELALPLEDHASNIVDDLEAQNLLAPDQA